jgi:hypothetical protein
MSLSFLRGGVTMILPDDFMDSIRQLNDPLLLDAIAWTENRFVLSHALLHPYWIKGLDPEEIITALTNREELISGIQKLEARAKFIIENDLDKWHSGLSAKQVLTHLNRGKIRELLEIAKKLVNDYKTRVDLHRIFQRNYEVWQHLSILRVMEAARK